MTFTRRANARLFSEAHGEYIRSILTARSADYTGEHVNAVRISDDEIYACSRLAFHWAIEATR